MQGKWKVTSQYCGTEKIYQVVRIRDTSKVDHSGNREYADGIFATREEAQALADELNEKER